MPGSLKTDAIVLRSMRYGEADRILHLYTPGRGRVSAIAKGVRKTKSRFGGRLEPFFRLNLVLYQGKSDLMTVDGAVSLAGTAVFGPHHASDLATEPLGRAGSSVSARRSAALISTERESPMAASFRPARSFHSRVRQREVAFPFRAVSR